MSTTTRNAETGQARALRLRMLRQAVDLALGDFFVEFEREPSILLTPGLGEAVGRLIEAGGKRLRPLLFLIAWRGYSGRAADEAMRAAVAIEAFHTFALMHDDLVDRSATRRGQPATHVFLAQRLAVGPEVGRSLALLAGDVTFAAAVQAILSMPGDPVRTASAVRELMRMAVDTGAGAFHEVATRQRPLAAIDAAALQSIQVLKTARYTFVAPLTVAAILAGAEARELTTLTAYGTLLGRAYQIRDDLADLRAFLDGSQPLLPGEIKLLWPFWRAYQAAGSTVRRLLERAVGPVPLVARERDALADLLESGGMAEAAAAETTSLLAKAEEPFQALTMDHHEKDLLRQGVLEFLQPEAARVEALV